MVDLGKKAWSHACAYSLGVVFCLTLGACGSAGVPRIGIVISPLCVEMQPGGIQQFNATIYIDEVKQSPDPDNSAVNWSVVGGGSISNAAGSEGLYQSPNTNPPMEPVVTVIAVSKEDSQRQGQATVFLSGPCPVVPPLSQKL